MKTHDYSHEVLKTFSLTHNYNTWVFNMLAPFLKGKILEIGCGVGNLTNFLNKCGELVSIDISENFIKHAQIDFKNVAFHCINVCDGNITAKLPKFDTVVCINVLEHIEDDKKAIRNMYDLLVPGGRLCIFVPAMNSLYGAMDKDLDHYRRYNKKELYNLVTVPGFKVIKLNYSNLIGIFGWYVNAVLLKRSKFSILQPLIFDKIVPLIEMLERKIPPPFGMSLLLIGEK